MKFYKKVSVIVPCRNEIKYIRSFLESVVSLDYPKDLMEVLIIDGMSDDGTREIIKEYIYKYKFIKLLDNPKKIVPSALNIGINNSNGDIIIRLDVHSIYPKDYIKKLVYYLNKLNADNIGGIVITRSANNSLESRAVAIALSNPFGVGNATFRLNPEDNRDYIEVDTVPFGCFKKEIFEKVGMFDEDLIRNQDNEFNERILKNNGKIYLIPSVKIEYVARDKLKNLAKMLFQYGYFGPLVDIKLKKLPRLRRITPLLFVIFLISTGFLSLFFKWAFYLNMSVILLYILLNLYFSTREIISRGEAVKLLPYLIVAHTIGHISYGFGYLKGILDFLILKKHKKKKLKDMQLTR